MRLFAVALLLLAACGGNTAESTCPSAATCVAVSACGPGAGHVAAQGSCGAASLVCCLPQASCPAEDFECCSGSARFRPVCDGTALACAAGQTRCP